MQQSSHQSAGDEPRPAPHPVEPAAEGGAAGAAEAGRLSRLEGLESRGTPAGAALTAVLQLADRLLELACADLLTATRPPPQLAAKDDDVWDVFGDDSDDSDGDDAEPAGEDKGGTATDDGGRSRASATAAVAGLREAVAALRASASSEPAGAAAAAAQSAAARCWDELEATGGWPAPAWREVFCLSSLVSAVATAISASPSPEPTQLRTAMRAADVAFIMGSPAEVCVPVCALLDARMRPAVPAEQPTVAVAGRLTTARPATLPDGERPIRGFACRPCAV